jgi:hypothetical protein
MGENNRTPEYLEPLLDGTPLAVERLREAWPGLAMSDRAYLVSVLLADERNGPRAMRLKRHRNAVIDLALADENGYIRYLAAKHVPTPDKQADASVVDRFERVRADPVTLVRYAQEEQEDHGLMSLLGNRDFARFWQKPQIARLALVSDESVGYVADLLRFATKELLPVGSVTLSEMADVLLQYLGRKFAEEFAGDVESARFSYDGFFMYGLGHDAKTLWELIPDIPKELSYLLLDRLPEPPYSSISTEVVESLDERQLEHLLLRNDIKTTELRRKIYAESRNESLRTAAVSSQTFELLDSDVSRLVFDLSESEESGRKKFNELLMLAGYCRGASLVQMKTICDLILDSPSNFRGRHDESHELDRGEQLQTERAKRLSSTSIECEVLEMRLFEFARRLSPMKASAEPEALPEKLKMHRHLVIPSNPWETYLNLRKAISLEQWKRNTDDLPSVSIQNFDLPDDSEADDSEKNSRRVFDLLTEVQSSVKNVSEQERAELSALSAALTKISAQVQEAGASTTQQLIGLQTKIRILFWALAAILLLLIFRLR